MALSSRNKGNRSQRVVVIEQSFAVMATKPLCDAATGDYIIASRSSEEDDDMDMSGPGTAPLGSMAYASEIAQPFVKSLLFRKDLQEQVQAISNMVRRELDAGQEVLISARWLAVSKNWSTVAVPQICLDAISDLKDKLVNDSSVRLVQTASHLNVNAIYLSRNAMVVQFNHGVSRAKEFLTMEDDCAVMIPLLVPEYGVMTAWDRSYPGHQINLSFSPTNGFVMSGRTVLNLESKRPLVCLIFSMAAMKEASYIQYKVSNTPFDPFS